MIHLRRLLKGIIYIGVTLAIMFNFKVLESGFEDFLMAGGYSEMWMGILYMVGFLSFAFLIVGAYFFLTCHLDRNPVFENPWSEVLSGRGVSVTKVQGGGSAGIGSLSNIHNICNYRDSVLSTKNQKDGASEYMKTAWIDGVVNQSGANTNSVLRYIDSNLSTMSNENGYEWLKNNS